MDAEATEFVPSRGPWELLDDNGLFHFVPGSDELCILSNEHDLHHSDLRKLVGLEQGNLKTGGNSEHSQHWALTSGARYIQRDGLDQPVAIFGGACRGIDHFMKHVAALRADMPFAKKKLLELLSPNTARDTLSKFKWYCVSAPCATDGTPCEPSQFFHHGKPCWCATCKPTPVASAPATGTATTASIAGTSAATSGVDAQQVLHVHANARSPFSHSVVPAAASHHSLFDCDSARLSCLQEAASAAPASAATTATVAAPSSTPEGTSSCRTIICWLIASSSLLISPLLSSLHR